MNSNTHILVIDDNKENLRVVSNYLNEKGYKIALALEAKSALTILENNKIDLVLLDVMMPEIDGFELCSMIRSDKKLDNIPIIFLTAKVDKTDILKGFELGGQDYITKPFDSRELYSRVNTQLELKKGRDLLYNMNQVLESKVQEVSLQLQKTNSELQKATDQLLLLDKAKQDFLRIISHEMRTPLNGIKGASYLLDQNVNLDATKLYMKILKDSVARLENFSHIAIEITQLQLDKYPLNFTQLYAAQGFKEAFKNVKSKIADKHITIKDNLSMNSPLISADKKLLLNAVSIVLENAVKHSPENSVVTTAIIQTEHSIIYSIEDNGPGLPEDMLKGEFKLFSNGDKHVDQNTGLCLTYVHLIAKAHSGELILKNEETGGAIVQIQLPRDV